MSDLDADSAAKRPRLNDSDDSDDEIWSHAIEQDEAIQTQRLTQQLLHPVSSQATLLSQQKQVRTAKSYPNSQYDKFWF